MKLTFHKILYFLIFVSIFYSENINTKMSSDWIDVSGKSPNQVKNIFKRLKKGQFESIEVEIRLLDSLNNYRNANWSEAANIAEKVINSPKASTVQKTRGKFYHIAAGISRKDEPEKSRDEHMKLLVKSADLLEEKTLGDPERIELLKVRSEALNNLGFVLLHNLNLAEEALPYFTDAIEINSRPEINDQKGIGIANGGLGDCYKKLGEIEKASEHYQINPRQSAYLFTFTKIIQKF